MSVEVWNSVWKHSTQEGTALLMLLAIADSADEYGECWPSVEYLAEKCRMKIRNAQLLIKRLTDAGELCVEIQKGQKTLHGKTNRFRVITPGTKSRQGGVQDSASRGAKSYTPHGQGVQSSTPQGVQNSVERGAILGRNGVQDSAPIPVREPSRTSDDVETRLEALGLYPSQVKADIAAAERSRQEFTLDDVAVCEAYIAREAPTFPKAVATLHNQYLRHGKLPPNPFPIANGKPNVSDDEAIRRHVEESKKAVNHATFR